MNKSIQNLFSMLTGAAIGFSLGILYAPGAGKKNREFIYYKLKLCQTKLENVIEEYKNKKENVTVAKSEGERVVKDAKDQAEILLKDVEDLMKQIKAHKKSN